MSKENAYVYLVFLLCDQVWPEAHPLMSTEDREVFAKLS